MLLKRSIPVWGLILILTVALIGTTIALSSTDITQKMNIFGGQISSTVFEATKVATYPKGHNKVTVIVTAHNTDAAAASGTVDVQLLNSGGDIISIAGVDQDKTENIVALGADAKVTITFTFTATGLVSQFSSCIIVFNQ